MSLKHSILALLSNDSKTGYQLSKDVQNSITFFWQATHQQVYRDLASLEQEGFVKGRQILQEEKPDKKVYSITKAGMKELLRFMKEPTEPPPTRDSFMIKLFLGYLVKPAFLLEDLRIQKQEHVARQKRFQEIKEKYFQNISILPIKEHYRYFTLRRGILLGKAWLTWCKEVEDFLKNQETLEKMGPEVDE